MKKIFFPIVLLLLSSFTVSGQVVLSKYAGEFLAIGVGGRASAMGGAQSAAVRDVTAGYWNPAGLAFVDYPQISLMHEEHFGNLVNYNYASVAIPYGKDMSFGASLIRLGVDGIPDTREALIDGVTKEVIYDITNPRARLDPSRITEFNNTDYALFLTFAKRHSDNFYFGANAKLIRRDIAEFGATGIGFDVGAVYMPYDDLYLGANIQDVTTTLIAWDTGRQELISPTMKIGAAYALDILGGVLTPAVDFDLRFEGREFASNFNIGPVSFDHHFGLEYNFQDIIAIRGGYNDVNQFTMGAGVKLPKLNIDYSFMRMNSGELERLPDSHRISLVLTLEEPRFLRGN
ncbi:MAG: hypothetical protein SCALA702_20110 [Melioribacteraceae bacterium]|nr:MAG: hypothetical protein SCALA702_20110 [Melioribacteraceae bacterium]